jgi:hypothetical protein
MRPFTHFPSLTGFPPCHFAAHCTPSSRNRRLGVSSGALDLLDGTSLSFCPSVKFYSVLDGQLTFFDQPNHP